MFRSSLSRIAAYAPSYVTGGEAGVADGGAPPSPADSPEKACVEGATRQFDFGRLVASFESVTFPASAPPTLPHTAPFLAAMDEVLLLFDHLGAAFAFVRRDISSKTSLLRAYSAAAPARFSALAPPILGEAAGSSAGVGPGAGRTLLRLMWALKFIDCLLAYLHETKRAGTCLAGEEATLRAAVAHAYAEALAEHHSWALRRTVRAALALLPSADAFLDKVCPDARMRAAYLGRLARSMTPLRETMYAFYAKHDLLGLP